MEKNKSFEKGPVLSLKTVGVGLNRPKANMSHHPLIPNSIYFPVVATWAERCGSLRAKKVNTGVLICN